MEFEVRSSTKEQISDQLDILRELFPKNIEKNEGLAPERAREKAATQIAQLLEESQKNHFFTIYALAELVGYLWLRSAEAELLLLYIYVVPHKRRQGYAEWSLDWIEEYAKENGYKRLGLHVFGGNTPAVSLYQKCGWSMANIRMVKSV